MKAAILVVEDDPNARAFYAAVLTAAGYRVAQAVGAEAGWTAIRRKPPELLLTDIELGNPDGLELIRRVRAGTRTAVLPVIAISGRKIGPTDQIRGMDRGADDYLLKPVDAAVLTARVRTLLRRARPADDRAPVLASGPIRVDRDARSVTVAGKLATLTRKEFDLLVVLLEKRGQALTREYLLDAVWGVQRDAGVESDTLKTHVSDLRAKLGQPAARLETVRGIGYRWRR